MSTIPDRRTAQELAAASGEAMVRTIRELKRRQKENEPYRRIAALEEVVEGLEAERADLLEFCSDLRIRLWKLYKGTHGGRFGVDGHPLGDWGYETLKDQIAKAVSDLSDDGE